MPILTLAVALFCFWAVANAQAAITVNDDTSGTGPAGASCATPDYSTIQAAVNAAPASSKVFVCPGSYEGATIEKELTIQGAQAGVDARERSADGSEEAVVSAPGVIFDVVGSGVVIEGFRLNPGAGAVSGVKLEQGSEEDIVENDVFSGFAGKAVEGVFEDATLRHNRVEGSEVGFESNAKPSSGSTIDSNLFRETGNYDIGFLDGGTGIVISRNRRTGGAGRFAVLYKASQPQIVENKVTEIDSPALYLGGEDLNPSILRNAFTGVADPQEGAIAFAGDRGFGANRRASIVGNVLTGDEIAVSFAGSSAGSVFDLHFNRLVGNVQAAIVNEEGSDAAVDATDNWWGCNAGPGAAGCDSAEGAVDTDPWLVLSLSVSPATIFEGTGVSRLVADVNHDSAGVVAGSSFPNNIEIDFATDLGSVAPSSDPTLGGRSTSTLAAGTPLGIAHPTATLDGQVVSAAIDVVATPEGQPGKNGETGKKGDKGSSDSVALKRKMSAAFVRPTVVVSGEKLSVELRCTGSTAQRCVGKVKVRLDGDFHKGVYSIAKRRKAQVSLPGPVPDAGSAPETAKAVAVTTQIVGRPVKTTRRLKLRWPAP